MPIRTNRGRAAVYRRLWGWPMRSPRHLAVVVFVVAAVVIAVGILVPQVTGSAKGAGGTAAASPTSTTGSASATQGTTNTPGVTGSASDLPTRITSVPVPSSAPPSPDALNVAERWARAWVDHPDGVSNEDWLDDLRPLTTEEQLTEMTSVEPGNIDATEVKGDPKVVDSSESSVKVELRTDADGLRITVIETPDGWRVAYYEQVS